MSRPPKSETERLRLAQDARNIVDKELKTMAVPKLAVAQNRAAARLGISPKTLHRRLADVPVEPTLEDIEAALLDPNRVIVIDGGEY